MDNSDNMSRLKQQFGFVLTDTLICILVLVVIIGIFGSIYTNNIAILTKVGKEGQHLHHAQRMMENALAGTIDESVTVIPWDGMEGRPSEMQLQFGEEMITIPVQKLVVTINPDDENSRSLCVYTLGLVEIYPGIYIPNVQIPDGMIMIFKGFNWELISAEELQREFRVNTVVQEIDCLDLRDGSLYIPTSAGDITLESNQSHTFNWEASGDIIVKTDVKSSVMNIGQVVSTNGKIIIDNASIETLNQNTRLNIEGQFIDVSNSTLSSRSNQDLKLTSHGSFIAQNASIEQLDQNGKISISALNSIDVSYAEIYSNGTQGIVIQSTTAGINAAGAVVETYNQNGNIYFESKGNIFVDGSSISSSRELIFRGTKDALNKLYVDQARFTYGLDYQPAKVVNLEIVGTPAQGSIL